MIVVDANIIAYLHLVGEFTDRAEALLKKDPEWAAPLLWQSEFRNLLAGYMRRKTLTFEETCELQAEAESLMAGGEHEVDSQSVLELVRESECSAYDCEYVALAMRLGVKLVTADGKLLKAFPKLAVPLPAA